VLGENLFLKGYRHLQIGTQPEFEIGRFLTDLAKFPNTVPVLGIVEYQGSDGSNMTLALLQSYVENQGDCWSYTLDYLSRFLEDCRTAVEPVEAAAQAHSAYLVLMHTLGQRTGELHNALGKVTGDLAFDPEPITVANLADWVLRVQAEAITTLDLLLLRAEKLEGAAQDAAKSLLARRDALAGRIQACISAPMSAVKTRYHGDFHLGQVLLTQNDFVFIDFEGEPARPLAERLHKHSPLRDVAGMLRSFNYVANAALVHVSADRPEDLARFELLLLDWETEVGHVFLAAYDEAVHSSEPLATQASPRGLIDLFLLEKALYEVRYELDNRPDWVGIPLLGILSLLQADIRQ
jgi:maltose alpha-D-glucosyltransferase/alpha-amylase